MGFHHMYDNANVKTCREMIDDLQSEMQSVVDGERTGNYTVEEYKSMINELEDHIQTLLDKARELRLRNESRRKRRKEGNEVVSDDEEPGSDDEAVNLLNYYRQ